MTSPSTARVAVWHVATIFACYSTPITSSLLSIDSFKCSYSFPLNVNLGPSLFRKAGHAYAKPWASRSPI